jgi:hypothetical protein
VVLLFFVVAGRVVAAASCCWQLLLHVGCCCEGPWLDNCFLYSYSKIGIAQSVSSMFCCWIGLCLLSCEDAIGCHLQQFSSRLLVHHLQHSRLGCWLITSTILSHTARLVIGTS